MRETDLGFALGELQSADVLQSGFVFIHLLTDDQLHAAEAQIDRCYMHTLPIVTQYTQYVRTHIHGGCLTQWSCQCPGHSGEGRCCQDSAGYREQTQWPGR